MRSGSLILVLLGTSFADGLSLKKRQMPAVFHMPLKHKQTESVTKSRQVTRDNTVSLPVGSDAYGV